MSDRAVHVVAIVGGNINQKKDWKIAVEIALIRNLETLRKVFLYFKFYPQAKLGINSKKCKNILNQLITKTAQFASANLTWHCYKIQKKFASLV